MVILKRNYSCLGVSVSAKIPNTKQKQEIRNDLGRIYRLEGVCVDNDDDIHNHNHNDNHHLGELAALGKDGVSECPNTKYQKTKNQKPKKQKLTTNRKWKILT